MCWFYYRIDSVGGVALAEAAFSPDQYRCAIAIAPVTDLRRMLLDEARQREDGHWVIDYWSGLMSGGETDSDTLDRISPAKHADLIRAPVVLIHSEDDTVEHINQSEAMARALDRAGKTYDFMRLEGEDHWLSVAETRLQTLQAIDAFLKEHLPVDPEAPPAVANASGD